MNNPAITLAKDNDGKSIWQFLLRELKPRGKWLTPFNIISIPIMLLGLGLINYKPDAGNSVGIMDWF